MPTQPDLSQWPALIEAVAKRWEDAPRLPDGFEVRTLPASLVFPGELNPTVMCRTSGMNQRVCLPAYAAEAALIRWAMEVGVWWTRTLHGGRFWAVYYDPIERSWSWRVSFNQGPNLRMESMDILSAHAAAIGAIVGQGNPSPPASPHAAD